MEHLDLKLVQTSLHWEQPQKNLEMLEETIRKSPGRADIILLPEMFSTGFTMNAARHAEEMDGTSIQWMRRVAAEQQAIVTGSLIIREEDKFYNRLIWMQPNGACSHYDKRHLFRLAEEEKTYSAGEQQWIMTVKGWKIFPLICYDLRFPVWSRRNTGLHYDLLIYVANWPERRNMAWKNLLPARAIENQCYVAGLNRVGNDGNGVYHSGDSVILDFWGNIIASAKPGDETILQGSLKMEPLVEFRNQFPFWKDADEFHLKIS